MAGEVDEETFCKVAGWKGQRVGACRGERCRHSGQELQPSVEGQKAGAAPAPIKGPLQGSMVTFGFLELLGLQWGEQVMGRLYQSLGRRRWRHEPAGALSAGRGELAPRCQSSGLTAIVGFPELNDLGQVTVLRLTCQTSSLTCETRALSQMMHKAFPALVAQEGATC